MRPISEIMTRDVAVIQPDANLQRAATMMRDLDVGALPVCDGMRLVGMITDRDIVVRASAKGVTPDAAKVADVMSKEVSWCFEDQTPGEVLQLMGDRQLRRVPVVSRDMELRGVVALGDLADEGVHTEKTLEEISRPAPPQPKTAGKHPTGSRS
jgi:CBS domain-containing protein